MTSRLRAATAFAMALGAGVLLFAPELAQACPSCAGQRDGGMARWIILGTMILLPFGIVFFVHKGIKRLDQMSRPSQSPTPTPDSTD